MHQTTETRRCANGAIDTAYYARNARKLRSEAIRGAASSFARFVASGFKLMARRRMPSADNPQPRRVIGAAE